MSTTQGFYAIPSIGEKVREHGRYSYDDPIGERVRAMPGEALDDIPNDEPRVTVRWERDGKIWRERRYVGDLVVVVS
jgi:hypothetical protein